MTGRPQPRVLSIPAGLPFLATLRDALLDGRLVPDFHPDPSDPFALADVTIFVPTRRAARQLRALFAEAGRSKAAILPRIHPLGEFDEDEALFDPGDEAALDLAPPLAATDRLLHLARLVRAWKEAIPAHVAERFQEPVVVPVSSSDAIWLARDLAGLLDEVETEGSDWTRLASLAPENLAGWWQVTLDFLDIVTKAWPEFLAAEGRSNPASHRSALIRAEAARLARTAQKGPVIAAGSTGSLPATAELLRAISRLPRGAVVLPGLDRTLDAASWDEIGKASPQPPILGHPQFGLAKLLLTLEVTRGEVDDVAAPPHDLACRERVLSEAMRPAGTTDTWADRRAALPGSEIAHAFEGVTLVEAARERDEAVAIAIALRQAVGDPERRAALVTGDRSLARRVSSELLRFGIRADDSGGTPLAGTPPATLLRLLLETAMRPGDPVAALGLLKHPLLRLGLPRAEVRHAAETIELLALRGGTGRPDVAGLGAFLEDRLTALSGARHPPFWLPRLDAGRLEAARLVANRLAEAVAPLAALRGERSVAFAAAARSTVLALESLGRGEDASLTDLYRGDSGAKLAAFLRGLVSAEAPYDISASEWPDVLAALMASEIVKPAAGSERRIAIWGALEARLQSVDTLVIGGLNEGVWPRKAEADRFLSRVMKAGIDLEPPERRIGQAAHDFTMAMGTPNVILTRSARSGEQPAVASRWLQRLLTFAGQETADAMRARGNELLGWARAIDDAGKVAFAARPNPTPPVEVRPTHFSVTEIETLRRDPYAIYARRILRLHALDPMVRDPGAAERGTLYHEILHRFSKTGIDPRSPAALPTLLDHGRAVFDETALPPDIEAVWWPRFLRLAGGILDWEVLRAGAVIGRFSEVRAKATAVGASGVTLSGAADRIDRLPSGLADILDYKTGSSPTKAQAHTLLAPQLALEGALLLRGAFGDLGSLEPADLAYVRLRPNGEVGHESVLQHNHQLKSGIQLSQEAWTRLERLLAHFGDPQTGYLSRALPFRETDTEGDYDHLARVLEWSAGSDGDVAEGGE